MSVVGNIFGEEPGKAAPILMLMFINIHHYFTDGVIWKISNPEVRRDLFAHVPSKSPSRRCGGGRESDSGPARGNTRSAPAADYGGPGAAGGADCSRVARSRYARASALFGSIASAARK